MLPVIVVMVRSIAGRKLEFFSVTISYLESKSELGWPFHCTSACRTSFLEYNGTHYKRTGY